MRIKRKVAIAVAMALVLGGLAAAAAAGVLASIYTTPVSDSMIFGSSGNIYFPQPGSSITTIGPIRPGECALVGVGDYIRPASCSALKTPYQLTETPITASSGV